MNSRKAENECFVYITLPGEAEFVIAGRFVLTTDRRDIPTGKIARMTSGMMRVLNMQCLCLRENAACKRQKVRSSQLENAM